MHILAKLFDYPTENVFAFRVKMVQWTKGFSGTDI